MDGLYLLVPTILTIVISLLVVRAGAIALAMTGMPLGKAKFQALSAFTGTGFTTREAESVVNNPIRRTIVGWLMILGHAGIVTVIITATSSLVTSQGLEIPATAVLLAVGVAAIYVLATRTGLVRYWEQFVEGRLKGSDLFEETPIDELLHLAEGYCLAKVCLSDGSQLTGRSSSDSHIIGQDLVLLGVERNADWLPAQNSQLVFQANDRLIVYGPLKSVRKLDSSTGGSGRHSQGMPSH